MKICYISLLVVGIVGAASIERRDGSPCAAVSQSALATLAASASGERFYSEWRAEFRADVLGSNSYGFSTISL